MEIADLVLISKLDSFERECKILKHQIESTMHFSIPKLEGWQCPVHLISSHKGINIDLVWKEVQRFKST